jgi:hypothetical protein
MSLVRPLSNLIWHYDLREDEASRHGGLLARQFPTHTVRRLANYAEAGRALDVARETEEYPWLILSDSVGVKGEPAHPSLASAVRAGSPLSVFFLFSGSIAAEEVEALKRAHQIIDACQKPDERRMLWEAARFHERWMRPTVVRLRDYIVTECEDPTVAYFPSDDGGELLSLIGLHREMILGTPLGLEQERVWGKVFAREKSACE